MNRKAILKKMARDCIPTIFALCFTGMYSVVDGLFIGHAVGDDGLAAVNLAWPIPAVITALGIGIGIGGSVLYSRCMGSKEEEEASAIFHVTITSLFLFGALISVLFFATGPSLLGFLGARGKVYRYAWEYASVIAGGAVFQVLGAGLVPVLRNRHRAFEAMAAMITGMAVNVTLNYILMFRVKIGIRGAAIGTVAAQCVVMAIALFCLYGKEKLKFQISFKAGQVWRILKTGIPGFGLSIGPSVVLIFTNYRCAGFGGDTAVACYAVISYVVFPVQSMLTGVGDGIQPLVSYYHGAGREDICRFIQRAARICLILLGVGFCLLVTAAAPAIPGIFGMSEEAGKMFVPGMRLSAVAFLFMGNAKLNVSYMNATMRVRQAMGLVYSELFFISPILLFVIPLFSGLSGVWISLPVTQAVMLLVCFAIRRAGKTRM